MIPKTILTSFREFGRDIFLRGLISSHAGNMSIRRDNSILITRKSSMLGHIRAGDVIEIDLYKDDSRSLMASTETVVHRAIYRKTDARAIIHTHPPYATLLSMMANELVPVDSEGAYYFKSIPVVTPANAIGSEEGAELVSRSLKKHRIVLMRGHGSFARGDNLEEAYKLTSSLEASAFYMYHLGSYRIDGNVRMKGVKPSSE